MPVLEDMQALTQEIAQAHGSRVQAADELRSEVTSMLADFERTQRTMSENQRTSLAGAKSANKAAVAGLLKGFRWSRKNMSEQLHSKLRRDSGERRAAAELTIAYLGRSKRAMASALRNALSQDSSARRAAVESTLAVFEKGRRTLAKNLRAKLSADSSERKSAVVAMLGGFDAAHRSISQSLRADLAQANDSRKAEVGALVRDCMHEQAQVRSERQAVRSEWQKLTETLQGTGAIGAGESVERNSMPSDVSPLLAPLTTEPAAEENPELAALRNRVFDYLADRPDGTRLVEIEEEMGVSRFQMSRVLRSLMDDNMVEKRDLLYFAI